MTSNTATATAYIPAHISDAAEKEIRSLIRSRIHFTVEVLRTEKKEDEYVAYYYGSSNNRPIRQVDADDLANANLNALQCILDEIKNEEGA